MAKHLGKCQSMSALALLAAFALAGCSKPGAEKTDPPSSQAPEVAGKKDPPKVQAPELAGKKDPAGPQSPEVADKTDSAKPLPPETVKVWSATGSILVGWMQKDEFGFSGFEFEAPKKGKGRALPAFSTGFFFSKGVLAKLPDPGVPFGLRLGQGATDADLLELAQFKSLQWLDLTPHEGDGHGAETAGRLRELADAEPCCHTGDGRGAEGVGRAEEPALAWT